MAESKFVFVNTGTQNKFSKSVVFLFSDVIRSAFANQKDSLTLGQFPYVSLLYLIRITNGLDNT